jgi:hypothetical protein
MEKSSQIAWKFVPLRHYFPRKVVPLIEVLLYLGPTGYIPQRVKTPAGYIGMGNQGTAGIMIPKIFPELSNVFGRGKGCNS